MHFLSSAVALFATIAMLASSIPFSVVVAATPVTTAATLPVISQNIVKNGLTTYIDLAPQDSAITVNFGAWNGSDQAYIRFDFTPEIDVASYTALELTLSAKNTGVALGQTPLLFQLYDNNWTAGASKEVGVNASVLGIGQTTVSMPLSDFLNNTFNPEKLRHLFIRVPQAGKVALSLDIVSMKWVGAAETAPTPPTPPVVAPDNTLQIDAKSIAVPFIDRGILGGNSVDDRVADYAVTDLFTRLGGTALPSETHLNRPLWRVHMIDKGQPKNYLMMNPEAVAPIGCLKNPMIPKEFNESNWSSQYPELNFLNNLVCQGQNYTEISWFDRSGTYGAENRHALSFTKVAGSGVQRYRSFAPDAMVEKLPAHNTYISFDFKLSSKTPFSVKDKALVLSSPKARMYINSDRTIEFRLGAKDYTTVLNFGTPLAFDSWYRFEVLVEGSVSTANGVCSDGTKKELAQKGTNALSFSRLWVNGALVSQTPGPVLRADCESLSTEVQIGTLANASAYGMVGYGVNETAITNDSYTFLIDELEMRKTKHPGWSPFEKRSNVSKYTSDVLLAHSFDNNVMTLLDYGVMAEAMNHELVLQVPHPCDTVYGCANNEWNKHPIFSNLFSPNGIAAMIEYMTGEADADYMAQVEKIKASGWSVALDHNWANLRALHGRVKPFDIRFVEVGNEPYYSKQMTEAGFAAWFIDTCSAIKSVAPGVRCVIPGNGSSSFNFEHVMKAVGEAGRGSLVDGFAFHQYVTHAGNRITDYPFKSMAGSYAFKEHFADKSIYESMQMQKDVKKWEAVYFADQPAASARFNWLTEFNTIINNFKSQPTDQALDAIYYATELAYLLEHGYTGASLFFSNGASMGEKWRQGLVGEYNLNPEVTLNGEVAKRIAELFDWGGVLVPVSYDRKIVDTEIVESNGIWKAPQVTAVANLSKSGKRMSVLLINRAKIDTTYTLGLSGFSSKPTALQHQLVAADLAATHKTTGFTIRTIGFTPGMPLTLPAQSVTILLVESN